MKLLLIFFAIIIGLSGCRSKSFGPKTVPNYTSVVPAPAKNERDLEIELRDLHKPDNSPYLITASDQFNFFVFGHNDLTQLQIMVTPDGYIGLPLLGPVKINGLTLPEATKLIADRMSQYIHNPKVSLIPYRINGFNFTITGRVNYPGTYPISIGQTRLIDAVALAKGFSQGLFHGDTIELADLDNAYISRNGKILPVNFKKAIYEGSALHNVPLKNGDYIYVPSTVSSNIALLGEVIRPTYVGYSKGMTICQALPYASGLRDTYSSEIKVIRGGLKNPVIFTVNLTDILNGKVMDFELSPNDIVYIPKDTISDWNVIVAKIMPTLQMINAVAGPFGNPGALMINNMAR